MKKKYSTTNYYTTSLLQMWYDRVWEVKKKKVSPCISNRQLVIICYVRVVAKKKRGIICGPKTT